MTVILFSKSNCGICHAAKEKLDLMKLAYEMRDYDAILEPHQGWREDGTVEFRAMAASINDKAPMIVVDGHPFNYSEAMLELKRLQREAASRS